jgi:hypothetical protein
VFYYQRVSNENEISHAAGLPTFHLQQFTVKEAYQGFEIPTVVVTESSFYLLSSILTLVGLHDLSTQIKNSLELSNTEYLATTARQLHALFRQFHVL